MRGCAAGAVSLGITEVRGFHAAGSRARRYASRVPDSALHSALEPRVFRVAELLAGVRQLLEDRVGRLWVSGEVSNLHRATSGHCYFSLKDETSQVRAVLFRMAARKVPFEIEEGLEVVVHAEVTVYEPRGDLQLIVRHIEPRGQGALQLALEQLRRRLEAEGLFDEARKRPLPDFPHSVGVVTSPTGAAVRDVIQVAGRLFPRIPLRLAPTRVQGEGAAEEIAEALETIGSFPGIEVVLLVRGGGSLEDLWAFNNERVVRAVVACPVPVVTGVGHEVDFTLVDAAADVRAPTPSAAAALALPDRAALREQLEASSNRLARSVRGVIDRSRDRWERELSALRMLAPATKLAAQRARLDAAGRRLVTAIRAQQILRRSRLAGMETALDSLSPLAVLARGYAVVRRKEDGAVVRRADQVKPGEAVSLRVSEARIEATVDRADPTE